MNQHEAKMRPFPAAGSLGSAKRRKSQQLRRRGERDERTGSSESTGDDLSGEHHEGTDEKEGTTSNSVNSEETTAEGRAVSD